MMDKTLVNKIRSHLNKEITKRLLIKYFVEQIGAAENFDKGVYPPSLQNITEAIPQLHGTVEVGPAIADIDPRTGYVKIDWHMFVLGNLRKFLGSTEHNSLNDLREAKYGSLMPTDGGHSANEATPREIITFILRTLSESEAGQLRFIDQALTPAPRVPTTTGMGPTFFRKNKMNKMGQIIGHGY